MEAVYITYGNERRIAKECVCQQCGKSFWIPRKEKVGRYCSRSCSVEARKNTVLVECANCGQTIKKNRSRLKNSKHGLYFCNRTCKESAQRIGGIEQLQLPHYGQDSANNYRAFARRELPLKCNRCGWDEHPKILQVHHKDRNRSNGALENLEIICPNCHALEHWG